MFTTGVFLSQSPCEYHIIDVIDKFAMDAKNVHFRSCEYLVVVISMVRHSPCEDYWNAKMTLLVTNKVSIFLSPLEMSKNTI